MYTPQDIVWVKNVLRQKGRLWAYDKETCDRDFLLHWSSKMRGSAETPKVGDIILLFQRPEKVNGRNNKTVYLTHLVTPVSPDIEEDPLSPKHKWARKVKLIAKASPLSAIPNPGFLNFFLPNRGLTNPIQNVTNNIGLAPSQLQNLIGNYFSNFLCKEISFKNSSEDLSDLNQDISGREGARIKSHIIQESIARDRMLIEKAKKRAYEIGNGRIECECCAFDFLTAYGDIGDRYIECHHKIHLRAGERITNLDDLALVCANCHRMLHRMPGAGSEKDIKELKNRLNFKLLYFK